MENKQTPEQKHKFDLTAFLEILDRMRIEYKLEPDAMAPILFSTLREAGADENNLGRKATDLELLHTCCRTIAELHAMLHELKRAGSRGGHR